MTYTSGGISPLDFKSSIFGVKVVEVFSEK